MQGLVFLLIAMRISSSASASAAASRHRSTLSTNAASALSLSTTLAARFSEGSSSHGHGKSSDEDDVERDGVHVLARSQRGRERTERRFDRGGSLSPIAIHVSVSTTSRSDSEFYDSLDVHSPGPWTPTSTPPPAGDSRLSRPSLDEDICEALAESEEYVVDNIYPEVRAWIRMLRARVRDRLCTHIPRIGRRLTCASYLQPPGRGAACVVDVGFGVGGGVVTPRRHAGTEHTHLELQGGRGVSYVGGPRQHGNPSERVSVYVMYLLIPSFGSMSITFVCVAPLLPSVVLLPCAPSTRQHPSSAVACNQ